MSPEPTEEQIPSPEATGTPGQTFPLQNHSWTLQQLHHLGNDVGKLQEAVSTLKDTVGEQRGAINDVRRTIYIATGFVVCLGLIGTSLLGLIAWLVDKGFDRLVEPLAK